MSDTAQDIRQHYDAADDSDALLATVETLLAALPAGRLTSRELGAIDQFHVGGLPATMQFMALLGLQPEMTVFDAGSGFGGPSRYAAETYGCQVTGVDLTPAYVAVSQRLAERTGTADRCTYRTGDLLALDIPDDAFDAMYTQHVVMNIHDRERLYREFNRVLKPGAAFGFHDILCADAQPAPHYPVPWADSPAISTVLTEAATRHAMSEADFDVAVWNDVTTDAIAAAVNMQSAAASGPSLRSIVGPRFTERFANLQRNLQEGRLRVVMGIAVARA